MSKKFNSLKKILIFLLILFILNNFLLLPCSNATSLTGSQSNTQVSQSVGGWLADAILDTISGILSGIIGLFTYPLRLIVWCVGSLLSTISSAIMKIDGADKSVGLLITPFDILFNKIQITCIDFFTINDPSLSQTSLTYKIRVSVAAWYYVFRILAVAVLLVVLIYVGIRMAISTISSDKARYKEYFFSWVASLAIVFLMHYLIIFVLTVNDALVQGCEALGNAQNSDGSLIPKFDEIYDTLTVNAIGFDHIFDVYSWGFVIMYCILIGQTFALFISYVYRMIKLAFLIIVAPLVTLTYSIDKLADSKAQAFNAWLKEFTFTVIQQPFQCIIYMAMVGTALSIVQQTAEAHKAGLEIMAQSFVAIACLFFVGKAEKLLKKIFNFETKDGAGSIAGGMATMAVAAGVMKTAPKLAKSGANTVKNFKAMTNNLGIEQQRNKAQRTAMKQIKNGQANGLSFEELTDKNLEEQFDKKGGFKIHGKTASNEQNAEFQSTVQKYQAEGKGVGEAKLLAMRDMNQKYKKNGKTRNINGATGTARKYLQALKSTDVVQAMQSQVALGNGLAWGLVTAGLTNQKAISVATGVAASKVVSDLTSNKTQAAQAATAAACAITAMGVFSKNDAADRIQGYSAEEYKEGSEFEKNIIDSVTKALNSNGINGGDKHKNEQKAKKMLSEMKSSLARGESMEQAQNAALDVIKNDSAFQSMSDVQKNRLTGFITNNKQGGLTDLAVGQMTKKSLDTLVADGLTFSAATSAILGKVSVGPYTNQAAQQVFVVNEATEDAISVYNAQECADAMEDLQERKEQIQNLIESMQQEIDMLQQDLEGNVRENLTDDESARIAELETGRSELESLLSDIEQEDVGLEAQINARMVEIDKEYATQLKELYTDFGPEATDSDRRERALKFEAALRSKRMDVKSELDRIKKDRDRSADEVDTIKTNLDLIINMNNNTRAEKMGYIRKK